MSIINHTKTYMQTQGLSASDMARMIGTSPATMSQLLANKYPGKADEMFRKLAAVTNYQESNWPLVATPNFRTVHKLCKDAQEQCRMMALYAETGMGKTTPLKQYAACTPNTIYILCNVLWKQKDFLKAIQKSLGSDNEGTIVERAEDIITRLLIRQNPLLIIDDIGKLKEHPKCFYLLQLIYDRTEGACGIVLSGTKAFPTFIQKQAAKDNMGFRELRRRISYWQPLRDRVEAKFIATICQQFNITQASAIQYIERNCSNYGDVKELITNYKRYCQLHGEPTEDEQQSIISSLSFSHLSI